MQSLMAALVLVKNEENWLRYALEASRGFFDRYVIYDVGSCDKTPDIIKRFQESSPNVSFFVRYLPHVDPRAQGAFRNSMIAEAETPLYFILDGDEIYSESSYKAIMRGAERLHESNKLYGLVRRIEVGPDLKRAWGVSSEIPHHRLYKREAIWRGSHPGEVAYYKQQSSNEMWIEGATCIHMHNTARSPYDDLVPGRAARKSRHTYRPGELESFNLIQELPILQRFEPSSSALKLLI